MSDAGYLARAARVAATSPDPRAKVGAVIVRDGSVLAIAANRLPHASTGLFCRLVKPQKSLFICHAEERAIAACARRGQATTGATIFVTRPPCATCMRLIIEAGIDRVVCRRLPEGRGLSWAASMKAAEIMAAEAGIPITTYGATNEGIFQHDHPRACG